MKLPEIPWTVIFNPQTQRSGSACLDPLSCRHFDTSAALWPPRTASSSSSCSDLQSGQGIQSDGCWEKLLQLRHPLSQKEGDINLSLIPSSVKRPWWRRPRRGKTVQAGRGDWMRGGQGGRMDGRRRASSPQILFLLGPPLSPQPCSRHPRTADQMAAALTQQRLSN